MGTVYFVNGFLEAGKTTFIKELIGKESFRTTGKTLILLCEEGDVEYEKSELVAANAELELIENEEDFNEDFISEILKKHRPKRVIVEYNGMWDRKSLEFPWYWDDVMEIAVFDASTFKLYSDNMRSLLAEQVRQAELVIFYKADEVKEKLASYARNIRVINNAAAFVFRGAKGDMVFDPDESLPYDIEAEELDLNEEGFAVFTMDALKRYDMYEGKRVRFTACVYKMKDGNELEFVAGRQVLTCCAADMAFVGIICAHPKAYEYEDREWVEISGIVKVRYDEELQRKIPVCKVETIERADVPENEAITLV
ncbi:MAG: GTPase [Lachnospiraceae bacterium]|nr:GTPase [Lachnospiraceae bacterium]